MSKKKYDLIQKQIQDLQPNDQVLLNDHWESVEQVSDSRHGKTIVVLANQKWGEFTSKAEVTIRKEETDGVS